jgi:hypothetical protein
MRPTCSATWPSSWQRQLWWLTAAFVIGCDQQDGVVGRNHPADAASDTPSFVSEFVSNDGVWSVDTGLARASVDFGRPDGNARDGNVAELLFPGDASLAATDAVGPAYVTQLATLERFHFGTLRARVRFGRCAATEEVIQAVLGYFSDGTDLDGNGLMDDVEIDLQISCAAPQYAYLSVYTDYQADGFRRLSHIVDFESGTEYDTPDDSVDGFVETGNDPTLVRPNLVSADTYYEVGYEWHPDSIRFFLVDGTDELTLWTLRDASHVPQLPVHLMFNLWHPETHWFPTSDEADFPANDVVMKVDWVEFVAEA